MDDAGLLQGRNFRLRLPAIYRAFGYVNGFEIVDFQHIDALDTNFYRRNLGFNTHQELAFKHSYNKAKLIIQSNQRTTIPFFDIINEQRTYKDIARGIIKIYVEKYKTARQDIARVYELLYGPLNNFYFNNTMSPVLRQIMIGRNREMTEFGGVIFCTGLSTPYEYIPALLEYITAFINTPIGSSSNFERRISDNDSYSITLTRVSMYKGTMVSGSINRWTPPEIFVLFPSPIGSDYEDRLRIIRNDPIYTQLRNRS